MHAKRVKLYLICLGELGRVYLAAQLASEGTLPLPI